LTTPLRALSFPGLTLAGNPLPRFVQCVKKRHLCDSGTFFLFGSFGCSSRKKRTELHMNGLIYLIGLIVVIMAVLSLLGLR
jgi:hypothetical protein